ncbi:MAG: WYL domain-containing protein [Verrucomicrobia bacterium]|nr:WYL domain-containing protein [Verrucomicrobiota bacterium]MDE3100528.1 WYL domain-containing protein [Verrucomicrobiota bacterium]
MKEPIHAPRQANLLSRPPLERMLRIHQSLLSENYPNATVMARRLEVAPKTVHRDMEFMRDRLNLPIEFDPARNGYHYSGEVGAFPTMQITEGELFALVVAEKALQQYRGTPFEKPLLSALKKMQQALPEGISINLADVAQTISFRTSAEPILDLKIFETLARAVARREQLELRYRKPGEKKAGSRRVDPYHLANINGEWFLFAFDHGRNDVRTFVPARIESATPTGRHFEPARAFSLQERLRDSFGVHSAEGRFEVVIRFNRRAADYVREKKWHDSQQLRELKAGGVEMRLRLSSLVEIERWILSWGGDAVAIKPRELADAIDRAARRLLRSR